MSGYSFVVPGPPTGKGRPRFVRATGRAYTDKQTVLAENNILWAWREAGQGRINDGPVTVLVEAVFERPQSHRLRSGALSAVGARSSSPTKKPDADNLLKAALDALNGHAWRDDAQVVNATVIKRWAYPTDNRSHVRIAVWPGEYADRSVELAA